MFWRRVTRSFKQAQMQKGLASNSTGHVKSLVTLPRLPVPDLRKTLDRYLASLEPLLLEDGQRGGLQFEDAYALRRKLADDFESGVGQVLQERLVGSFAIDFTFPSVLNVTKHLIGYLRIIGLTIIFGCKRPILSGELRCLSTQTGGWPSMTTR